MRLHRPEAEIVSIIFDHIPNPRDVRAVMLYGSRADGRAVADSDYDLAIICDPVEVDQMGFFHEGISYSCFFYPSRIVQPGKMDYRTAFFCFRAKPLYDPDGIGARFARISDSLVAQGSKATGKRCREIEDYLESLAVMARGVDAAADHARTRLLLHGLDMSFLYHGMPDVGCKRELEVLLRDDPDLFDCYVRALLPGAPFEDVRAWLDAALSEPFKADSMDLEFPAPAKIDGIAVTDLDGRTWSVRDLIRSRHRKLLLLTEA